MELFSYCPHVPRPGEVFLKVQDGVRFYNGEDRCKIARESGKATLSNMRILWDNSDMQLALELKQVVFSEKEKSKSHFQFHGKPPKIVLHVSKGNEQLNSPFHPSNNAYLKMCFGSGGLDEFFDALQQVLNDKQWEKPLLPSSRGHFRAGIVGIERQLEKNARDTEKNISEAFQDINSLIDMAKPMVKLAESIANKMKEKQGSVSDNDTVTFRQQLLSLGITDPVTKSKYGSGNVYFEKLALELSSVLESQVKECGGIMSLVEAFCRISRARGVELVSPEDLMNACYMLEKQNQPLRLRDIGNKVMVLQHVSFDDDMCVAKTLSILDNYISLTPEEYANIAGVPFLLAKHSLILTENSGSACRDDSLEGLRFYSSGLLLEDYDDSESEG